MMLAPKLRQVDFDIVAPLLPADATAARVASRNSLWEIHMPRQQQTPEKLAGTSTKRTPITLPDHPKLRMVSRPNGLWRVEYRVREAGTRTLDNWEPISRDMEKEAATRRMLGVEKTP
jgi:hypothetical protein